MTSTATEQLGGPRHWVRTVLLITGFALLVGALPSVANAEEKSDPTKDATTGIEICEAIGGEATVNVHRSTNEGVYGVSVQCDNSFQDYYCVYTKSGFSCVATAQQVVIAQITAALESGSPRRITAMLADLDAANVELSGAMLAASSEEPAARHVSAGNGSQDHDQDRHQSKSKHGKHGKKGGKGHKK